MTRGLTQRLIWLTGDQQFVATSKLGVSRGIEGYTKKLEGEVNRQHPARVWVERKERKSAANRL
jgi:hypothetical protein